MMRALASLLPPTGNGMTRRTTLPGNACARTPLPGIASAAATAAVHNAYLIVSSGDPVGRTAFVLAAGPVLLARDMHGVRARSRLCQAWEEVNAFGGRVEFVLNGRTRISAGADLRRGRRDEAMLKRSLV